MQELTRAQEEFFKNSLIRNNDGSLKVLFHGSPNHFDTFDRNRIGRNGTSCGVGFNFTPDREYAELMTKQAGFTNSIDEEHKGMLIEAYINITKALSVDKFTLGKDFIDDAIELYNDYCYSLVMQDIPEEIKESMRKELYNYYDEKYGSVYASDSELLDYIGEVFTEHLSAVENSLEIESLFAKWEEKHTDEIEDTWNEEADDYEWTRDTTLLAMQKEIMSLSSDYAYNTLGYDGYIGTSFNGSEVIVAIRENQIKSVNNLYPTKSDNFRDNSQEYLKENKDLSFDERCEVAKHIKERQSHDKQREILEKER